MLITTIFAGYYPVRYPYAPQIGTAYPILVGPLYQPVSF